jgi:hypothetical protein
MHELCANLLCRPSDILSTPPLGLLKVRGPAVHEPHQGDDDGGSFECGVQGVRGGDVGCDRRQKAGTILNKGVVQLLRGAGSELDASRGGCGAGEEGTGYVAACEKMGRSERGVVLEM